MRMDTITHTTDRITLTMPKIFYDDHTGWIDFKIADATIIGSTRHDYIIAVTPFHLDYLTIDIDRSIDIGNTDGGDDPSVRRVGRSAMRAAEFVAAALAERGSTWEDAKDRIRAAESRDDGVIIESCSEVSRQYR
jgi:hypothetical protein